MPMTAVASCRGSDWASACRVSSSMSGRSVVLVLFSPSRQVVIESVAASCAALMAAVC